jgi:hypothetical protein
MRMRLGFVAWVFRQGKESTVVRARGVFLLPKSR